MEVVFVTGSELSLFTKGFLPGDTLKERADLLTTPDRVRKHLAEVPARINAFLARAVAVVRARFGGTISYASLPFEGVDWTPFDVIASDAGYRSREIADRYRASIRAFDLRRSRYVGLPKTHLQHLGIATAINLVRLVAWLNGNPLAPTRVSAFERLSNAA